MSLGISGDAAGVGEFRTVGDHAARQEALDPTRSFIVQAPAGSGKTGLLIRRFLKLLAGVALPESVVALTFTRKAAAEMRHRVIAALAGAQGSEPEDDHDRQTWQLAREVLRQSDALGWEILQHPSRLRIQTLDSLSASIVGQMPWVSRMGAPARTDAQVRYLYRRAARQTLEALSAETSGESEHRRGAAVAVVLTHLDGDIGSLERLLAAMLERRDQWLRHVVDARQTADVRRQFEAVLREVVEHDLVKLRRLFPREVRAPMIEAARFAASSLLEGGIVSPISACAGLEELPDADAGGLDAWLGLCELLLTRDGRRRRTLDKRQGFPPTAHGQVQKARALEIELDPRLIARLHDIRLLPPPSHSDAQWRILESLLELLPAAVAHLKLIFRREGRVDFTEVSQAARTALGSPGRPTGLAFALDCSIQHLLVDEFQDTSQSQFELLEMLTSDWQPGDGRTLFLVGDPMQSIYGFRDADVALFLRARREGVGALALGALTLSTNFRSVPGIVDWVNRAVGPQFSTEEDMLTGAVPYERSVAHMPAIGSRAGPGGVKVHPFFGEDDIAEADRVLEIIGEARQRDPGATIGVLVSARGHLARIVAALGRKGIPFEAVEVDRLASRPVVQDLIALTRALVNPADRVSWLAILRAPWCGLTLTDLEWLVRGDPVSAVWDLIRSRLDNRDFDGDTSDARGRPGISADGSRRLVRVRDVLREAMARRGTLPLRRWVEETWLSLGGPATVETRSDLEDGLAWLDLLAEAAPGSWIRNEDQFLEAIDALFARPDPETERPGEVGSLQLLTIHKAKGLEFDTLILPGLGRATRSDPARLMTWLEYVGRHGGSGLLLAPIPETGGVDDALSRYLKRVETARRENESTRLLYVAATRARRYLHVLGHVRLPKGVSECRPAPRSLLAKVWPGVAEEFGNASDASLDANGAATRPEHAELVEEGSMPAASRVALRRLSSSWKIPEPPSPVLPESGLSLEVGDANRKHPTFDWATDLQRRVGIVVHRMLQHVPVGQLSAGAWSEETIGAALASEGVGADNMAEARNRVSRAIRNTLEDGRGRWVLALHHEDRREYPVSHVVAGRVRRSVIDRTFVEDGVRWIIDYKTGVHRGSDVEAFLDNEQTRYRDQLEDYARAMSSMDPLPVRLGLYFPLLGGWREWAFDGLASSVGPEPTVFRF